MTQQLIGRVPHSPANILVGAQQGHTVIQDFTPLAESLEWELGQTYSHECGSKVFMRPDPVPFAVNNNGTMSVKAAELFFASLLEAERSAAIEDEIFVLEIGIGLGLFARFFLDAFRELCAHQGKNYYDRLFYVAADRSEQMLTDASKHGTFASHPGRYLLRAVDALHPERGLINDPTKKKPSAFRAIFLNYILDCLPAAVLEVDGKEVRQLFVRTCLARGALLQEYTDITPEDLSRFAVSRDPSHKRLLLDLFGLFATAYDYRSVDVRSLPYSELIVRAKNSGGGKIVHSYGAIQCLDRLLNLLHDQGFILVNDYGSAQGAPSQEFEHQRYTASTYIGVNFAMLKTYFGDLKKRQWVEPPEDSQHIYSRLLGNGIGPQTVTRFKEDFGKAAFDWLEEPWLLAKNEAKHGRYEAAAVAFRQALERQPRNWILMGEVATFLAFALRETSAALDMARAALELNPSCSAYLWNVLGDCLFSLGRIDEARQAYEKVLEICPDDVAARLNLAWVFNHRKKFADALRVIAEGLALDTWGEYHERLLEKQAQVLSALAERSRQMYLFQANRVSNYYQGQKVSPDG